MEGIDFNKIRHQFCFVPEEQSYYNKFTKRKIKEQSLRKKIVEVYPELTNRGAIIDDIIEDVRNFGYTPAQFGGEKLSKTEYYIRAFEEIKPSLPLLWYATVSGEDRLYFVNENREVTFSGENSFQNFSNVIRASSYLSTLQNRFETGDLCQEMQSKFRNLDFEAYLRILYDKFKFDKAFKMSKEPPIITHHPTELAYTRFDPDMLQEGKTPTWDQFLARVNYPEILMAWIWSIFEPKNKSRQALWLHGRGNDGKSSVIAALTDFLGKTHCMAIDENTSSQFFFSSVYGKRLVSFGDCKSPRYLAGSKVHSMIGGDYVSIERKGEQSFNGYVHVKLIVASNFFPQIDFSMANETTRLILLKIKQPKEIDTSIDFAKGLRDEKWCFLHKCKQMYDKHCPSHYQIKCPKELWEEMEKDASSEEGNFVSEFIDNFLDFTNEESKTKLSDLNQRIEEVARTRGIDRSKFTRMKRDLSTRLEDDYELTKKKIAFGTKRNGKREIVLGYEGVKVLSGVGDE